MGDHDKRLIGIFQAGQNRVEPAQIMRGEMTVGHAHLRTLMHANEFKTGLIKYEFILPPEMDKFGSTRFGPFGIMVTGYDVIGHG